MPFYTLFAQNHFQLQFTSISSAIFTTDSSALPPSDVTRSAYSGTNLAPVFFSVQKLVRPNQSVPLSDHSLLSAA